jgi:hypothetical protein
MSKHEGFLVQQKTLEEKQQEALEKLRKFLISFVKKEFLTKEDKEKLETELKNIIKKLLPAFAQVCAEDERVLPFLKKNLSTDYWDDILSTFHESFFMPEDCGEKTPQPGFHSLDLILGYFHCIASQCLEKENKLELANQHLEKSMQYGSFYGLTYYIRLCLNEGKKDKSENILLQIKDAIVDKMQILNKLHGTPAYIYSGAALLELASFFSEKHSQVVNSCYSLAAVYFGVAKETWERGLCKTSFQNVAQLYSYQDLFEQGTKSTDNFFSGKKNAISKQINEEYNAFLQRGFFAPPSEENILYLRNN